MASEIRVNSLTNRSGLSTVSITDAGLNAVGIITAHNFKTGTTNVHSTGVTAADGVFTGNVSVTGNLNVSGALTYEDVTNVDAVGLSTFRNGIHVTGGSVGIGTDNPTETLTLNHANGASIGLEYSGTENGTINVNSAAMYVRAGTGKHLILGSNATEKLRIDSDGRLLANGAAATNAWTGGDDLVIGSTTSGKRTGITLVSGNDADGGIYWSDGTGINVYRGQIVYNHTSDRFSFYTAATERIRITNTGRMGVGTNDPAALLEVRDSENTTKGVAQIRISKGVGNGAAPTSVSRADSYLHIGGSEYNTSFGKYNIAFGYTNDEVGSGIPAYIGFVETSLAGYTQGDLVFGTRGNTTGTDNPTERLRIGSGGGHKITCAEGYYAANLTECNDGRIALNINQTRSGQTKAIAIGAVSGNSVTGIQCYDTSNNSANNLILNPFGGNMGLGTNNPTSDGGTTFEIYDVNTPSIRLNDGGEYKALFQLRGNDLEIRGSNGQLEFYTGNADGASSSLRGAITSAGHKWTHNGSIFHGSNDVTDFTDASRATYNNVSIRAGHQSAGTSPTNTNSAIKIYPAGVRSNQTGNLTGGIAWQHLDPNNGAWGSTYGSGSQIWMGAALHDTPGQERDRFNLWMNDQTTAGSNPNNLAIEAYPNGIVRHPKVPAFNAKGFSAHRDLSTWHNVDLNNWIYVDQNGSHYNNSNGRFTAPVAGKYFFIYTSMFHNPQTADFHNIITKNGTIVVYSNNHSGGGNANGHQWNDCTCQILITLAAGDYVTARSTGGSNATTYLYGSGTSNYSTFCGFLIG